MIETILQSETLETAAPNPFKRTLLTLHMMGSISFRVELNLLVLP